MPSYEFIKEVLNNEKTHPASDKPAIFSDESGHFYFMCSECKEIKMSIRKAELNEPTKYTTEGEILFILQCPKCFGVSSMKTFFNPLNDEKLLKKELPEEKIQETKPSEKRICAECGGSGFWECDDRGHAYVHPVKCTDCNGTGRLG